MQQVVGGPRANETLGLSANFNGLDLWSPFSVSKGYCFSAYSAEQFHTENHAVSLSLRDLKDNVYNVLQCFGV